MDEIHIEEFANVLKAIEGQLGWQVVVAVHEKPLFDYLKRMLYPSKAGQSLIGYELTTGSDGPQVTAECVLGFDPTSYFTTASSSTA